MRSTVIEFQLASCLDDGSKVQVVRGAIKLQVNTQQFPSGNQSWTSGVAEPPYSESDIRQTLSDIMDLVTDGGFELTSTC